MNESVAAPTILLVDDSPLFRSILASYLSPLQPLVIEADDGNGALAKLEQRRADVVLADVTMAGMNGIELVRAIRAHLRKEIRTVPIVLITAERDDAVLKDARRAGADQVLLKPISPIGLRNLVKQLTARV